MHSDNKAKNGKQDEPELGDIEIHLIHEGKEEYIDDFYKTIEEQKAQTCKKFEFFPFPCKCNREKCNYQLDHAIQDNS